ncbi:MAG: hypothetical protein JWO51_2558 [Rhodospirillales bacterium]|nr:hypothetical protein [Rhodospirillales bacterium]
MPTAETRGARRSTAAAVLILGCGLLGGCLGLSPSRLDNDQLGYSQALGDADKRQTLLNVVRLRYGDSPTFLQATQVISAYQLQQNATGGFELLPAASAGTFLTGGATAQLQQSPTFTFQPLTGEQFAQSFIHPLPPADLLSLAIGGLPIDVLFRLGVQSINGLNNASALSDVNASGSAEFFLLLYDLRRLQIAGLLSITLQHEPVPAKGDQQHADPGRVYLSLAPATDPGQAAIAAEVRHLIGVPATASQIEVIYGRFAAKGQVAIFTRSMLGALEQLAIQTDVPGSDVTGGRTQSTVGNIGVEHRPVVVIQSGAAAPPDAFTAVPYHQTWFWIANDDFDSKLAYTVLQLLLALSRAPSAPGTIVTIPAH